jgi:hypothetical protein
LGQASLEPGCNIHIYMYRVKAILVIFSIFFQNTSPGEGKV